MGFRNFVLRNPTAQEMALALAVDTAVTLVVAISTSMVGVICMGLGFAVYVLALDCFL